MANPFIGFLATPYATVASFSPQNAFCTPPTLLFGEISMLARRSQLKSWKKMPLFPELSDFCGLSCAPFAYGIALRLFFRT